MTTKSNILKQFRIVLCATSHAGNIGSVARAMKTMGFSELYLVSPKDFPSDHANALSCGAEDILQKAFQSLKKKNINHVVCHIYWLSNFIYLNMKMFAHLSETAYSRS